MRPDLSAAIVRMYPDLYPKGFQIECGDGWYIILRRLSMRLSIAIMELPRGIQAKYKATTVKSKFGMLRVHMTATTPVMQGMINDAEKESAHTCEQCGKPAKRDQLGGDGGPILTLCQAHLDERFSKRSAP